MPIIVSYVQIVDGLRVWNLPTEKLDDLLSRHLLSDLEIVVGHEATSRILVIGQQFTNVLTFFRIHFLKHRLLRFSPRVLQDIRSIIWVHLLQNVGCTGHTEPFQDTDLDFVVLQFGQRIGCLLVVQRFEQSVALIKIQIVHDVRQIRRVQFREFFPRCPHLHATNITPEGLYKTPRNRVLANLVMKPPLDDMDDPCEPSPAHEAPDPGIGCYDTQLAVTFRQLNIVHTHDLGTVDVDNLFVQNMVEQQHGGVFQLEVGLKFGISEFESTLCDAQTAHVVPRHARQAALRLDENSHDDWELLASRYFKVSDRADYGLLAIQNAHAKNITEVEHLRLLGRENGTAPVCYA